ncbi:eCIS core domain-containing protein [Arenibacterium sp. CAU 1754]
MRARIPDMADPVGTAVRAALATPGRSLAQDTRGSLETRLGGDLGRLSVHRGPEADHAADRLGARGFAVGRHAVLASRAAPDTLAHEAAHALQQDMAEPRGTVPILPHAAPAETEARSAAAGRGPVRGGHSAFLGRDRVSPGRLEEVHRGVRVEGPPRTTSTGATAPRLAWVAGDFNTAGSTAHLIHGEARQYLMSRSVPTSSGGPTNDANLDADALVMHRQVLDYYPQIPSRMSDTELQSRVHLTTSTAATGSNAGLRDWTDNFIGVLSPSANQYQINFSDSDYRAMVTDLITNADTRPRIAARLAHHSGFAMGTGRGRSVFVHPRVSATRRQLTLIHEIIHVYRHDAYQTWVDASLDELHYNEGLTEWLTRQAMTPAQLAQRGSSSYDQRVNTVQSQIAQHVSEDGIARAFFRGEVWRLETRSDEARAAFGTQTGIAASGTRAQEISASRSSGGYFQTVRPENHYRFINLGVDESRPKTRHVEAFREVKRDHLDPEPARRVRFVGHASGPGSEAHNDTLSERRSVAFYRMAQREGLPWARLADADSPPHFGEARPSVTEADADPIARAMNRRVDMFLVDGGGP